MTSARGAGADVIKLLDSVPDIDAESKDGHAIPAEDVHGHIQFENIHLRYTTRPGVRVLRELSFEVEPGTYVALVGVSGSGKSIAYQIILHHEALS